MKTGKKKKGTTKKVQKCLVPSVRILERKKKPRRDVTRHPDKGSSLVQSRGQLIHQLCLQLWGKRQKRQHKTNTNFVVLLRWFRGFCREGAEAAGLAHPARTQCNALVENTSPAGSQKLKSGGDMPVRGKSRWRVRTPPARDVPPVVSRRNKTDNLDQHRLRVKVELRGSFPDVRLPEPLQVSFRRTTTDESQVTKLNLHKQFQLRVSLRQRLLPLCRFRK